ncbi:MAG TPA: hypothetical protein VN947_03025 [Polyangia bacterium]|nr:hypothetical protein [Polyangia bacterium]
MTARALLMMLVVSGCAPHVRFSDRAILWHDPDDKPIPVPAPRDPPYHWVAIRDAVFNPLDQVLAIDFTKESVNVNAVDEVPDSSWWSDRTRVPGQARPRALTPDEMARGAFGDAPRPKPPLTITKGKEKGGNLGFIVKDALGRQFAIKIDPPGYVSLDTSTEVVVSRLAWAAGWNVPAESILDVHPGDLVLSPKATVTNALGQKKPLDAERWRKLLARAPMSPDGTIRLLASLWIDGIIVGPFAYEGRRRDDANDRVAHQDRRDLRGYGVFSSWVNDVDTTEANTLDSYVGERGRGHLVHYQQDVGGSFGSRAAEPMFYWMGSDTYFSGGRILGSLASFGIASRPWEGDDVRARRARLLALYPELGWYDDFGFDPRHWHPIFDNPAFERATARDRYWGAKRLVLLGEPQLRAAIAEGRYRPAAAERLYTVLWRRRDAILRAYLREVPALDWFRVDKGALCWDDLWIVAGLDGPATAEYSVDGVTRPRGSPLCAPVGGGRRTVALRVRRGGERTLSREVKVHLVDRRIVGVER